MHVFQHFLSFAWKLKFYQEQQTLSSAITDSLFIWENVCQIFKSQQSVSTGGFPVGSDGKESASNARDTGDMGSIPGPGRSPGRVHGSPLQYSCLENPGDGGAWWAMVHGVTKNQIWLSCWAWALVNVQQLWHLFSQFFFISDLVVYSATELDF